MEEEERPRMDSQRPIALLIVFLGCGVELLGITVMAL